MRIISREDWAGSIEDLRYQVALHRARIAAHRTTIGQPAPRDIELVESLAASGDEFDLAAAPSAEEASPPAPLKQKELPPEELEARAKREARAAVVNSFTVGGKTFEDLRSMDAAALESWMKSNLEAHAPEVVKLLLLLALR